MVWLCGLGLALALVLSALLVGFIVVRGITVFWPPEVLEIRYENFPSEPATVTGTLFREQLRPRPDGTSDATEWQIFVGHRDDVSEDFQFLDEADILAIHHPPGILRLRRTDAGDAFVYPVALTRPDGSALHAEDPAFDRTLRKLVGVENARLTARFPTGEIRELPLVEVLHLYAPNQLTLLQRCGLFLETFWRFLAESPRQANTAGGIFPAIFGTFVMTVLMSAAVMPFGVLAALYLHEYAGQSRLVRSVRVAVNNLAGVPSIVFGVFGLGFFVYGVGGTIDSVFFADRPSAVFGTGGILWASLTLALLTVPVVIVASEEALAAVPQGVREASLACGASKWQMIYGVVLPASAPGILTGLILAMARGAGEVAPLMIVGVVKLAPSLPIDGEFPFFHLERKFMHLGFHIYDLAFQSPDAEAALPFVFATTFLLLLLVLILNVGAILLRNHLRQRYAAGTF